MKTISVANQKGGVGKSTTCAHLGAALSELGKTVLLVDLDPQAGLTVSLGSPEPEDLKKTIYDVLLRPEEVPLGQVKVKTKLSAVDLVPSNLDLAGAEAELLSDPFWPRTLADILKKERENYDFALLDCPPSLGVLTTNALVAANEVLIPLQCEFLAMRGLAHLLKIIDRIQRKGNSSLTFKILLTMFDSRTTHSKEVQEEIRDNFPEQTLKTIIKKTIKFADSTVAGKSLLELDTKHPGAEAYREVAKEILSYGQEKRIAQG